MNLVVDVGNSYTKLAVFKNRGLTYQDRFLSEDAILHFEKVLKRYPEIKRGIVSSVGHFSKNQQHHLDAKLDLLVLDKTTPVPFNNRYATPETLGKDRIALVSSAVSTYPGKNVLIVDAGTCITYDFVTDTKDYLGGAISPGLNLRYKSLNNYTANLPLLESKKPDSIIGNSTETSIHSGVVKGVLHEIEGAIAEYTDLYNDLTVILTGGDGNFLSKQLKNSIFANSNFLLEGLNFILDHNSN